jgi:hypothetical protein
MATLNQDTLELTTTLRKAPRNGAPISQDYNDSCQEVLVDLSSITSFLNDSLLPILNALPETAAAGLEGKTLLADSADQGPLFRDGQTNQPLTVADCVRQLRAMIAGLETDVNDLTVEVSTLQTRVSASNQNDIVQTLQNLSQALTQQAQNINLHTQQLSDLGELSRKSKTARLTTVSIAAGQDVTMDLDWSEAFVSNAYTPQVSLEDASNKLQVIGWVKRDAGVGLSITVHNSDSANHAGTLCALALAD